MKVKLIPDKKKTKAEEEGAEIGAEAAASKAMRESFKGVSKEMGRFE